MDTNSKLEKVLEAVARIDVTLVKQAVTLETHIARTRANEAAIDHIRAELRPLAHNAVTWGALAKIVGALSAFTTIVLGALKIMGILH